MLANLFFNSELTIFLIGIVIILGVILYRGTVQVNESERMFIERLGKLHALLEPGIHFIIPFIDEIRQIEWAISRHHPATGKLYFQDITTDRIDVREAAHDFPKQNVITKDNVTMEINALMYYQITDPLRAVYEVYRLPHAIEKITQTTLRDVIGSMDLDECLSSRDSINTKLTDRLSEATDKWGVKVNRVELQEVSPPQDIKLAMEKQMKAERERRAQILEAEGHKQADILKAEGERQAKVERATGEAQAKTIIARADSEAIELIRTALPTTDPVQYIIANNYIKALPEMVKEKSAKVIIVPYEMGAFAGALTSMKELFVDKGDSNLQEKKCEQKTKELQKHN